MKQICVIVLIKLVKSREPMGRDKNNLSTFHNKNVYENEL